MTVIWKKLIDNVSSYIYIISHTETSGGVIQNLNVNIQALVACTLYNAMAYEAEDDDLDVEIYEELIQYSKQFQVCS